MTLIKPFDEKDLEAPNPIRLLPKRLQQLILVYKAGVESGLIHVEPQDEKTDEEPVLEE